MRRDQRRGDTGAALQGTAVGAAAVASYNADVAQNCARLAMLAPLRAPLAEPHGVFRDVLRLHWAEKGPQIRAWMQRESVPQELRTEVRPPLPSCMSRARTRYLAQMEVFGRCATQPRVLRRDEPRWLQVEEALAKFEDTLAKAETVEARELAAAAEKGAQEAKAVRDEQEAALTAVHLQRIRSEMAGGRA